MLLLPFPPIIGLKLLPLLRLLFIFIPILAKGFKLLLLVLGCCGSGGRLAFAFTMSPKLPGPVRAVILLERERGLELGTVLKISKILAVL